MLVWLQEEVLAEEGSLEVMTDFEGLRWFQEAKRHLGFDGWQNKAFGVPCEWRKEVNGCKTGPQRVPMHFHHNRRRHLRIVTERNWSL